jgi:signal transduction protein with GAF and PtsI domain
MSVDSDKNLAVLTDHIRHLATMQNRAADQIDGANRAIVDPARNVMDTHGLACGATNLAVEATVNMRQKAGAAMQRVSTEFAEKLAASASTYDGTDVAGADAIGQCEM